MEIRTDLALECDEDLTAKTLQGIAMKELQDTDTGATITTVKILNETGSKHIGKPIGHYVTLEIPALTKEQDSDTQKIVQLFVNACQDILTSLSLPENFSVLLSGLGNRDVTADALGPMVMDHMLITRHMKNNYPANSRDISCITPDVMAKTGMESAEIIKAVIEKTHPNLLIAVDALAARSIQRLYSTIQISTAGIYPGSGVGNHRLALTKESMGIPVIAIGIPTVVDAATIVLDALKLKSSENEQSLQSFGSHKNTISKHAQTKKESASSSVFEADSSKNSIAKSVSEDCSSNALSVESLSALMSMYVTTKDIDSTVKKLSLILSLCLNTLLAPEYSNFSH